MASAFRGPKIDGNATMRPTEAKPGQFGNIAGSRVGTPGKTPAHPSNPLAAALLKRKMMLPKP